MNIIHVDSARCVGLVDREGIATGLVAEEWVASPLREKYGKGYFLILGRLLRMFATTLKIQRRYRIESVISTGPGISIVPALLYKLLGRKVIHIETWSRFKTRSPTGRVMYVLADKFYVQNRSLLKFYPRATYSGRL